MSTWPPTLAQFKNDQKIDPAETRDDERFQSNLDAAVAWIEGVRPEFNYHADPLSTLPEPTENLVLGIIRLAARWKTRTNSPDGLVSLGAELGSARIPSFDPDIERMLGIGRFKGLTFA